MNNIITITLDDTKAEHEFHVKFKNDPSLSELVCASLVLDEVMEHNFKKEDILLKKGIIFQKIRDLEEIRRTINGTE